MLKYVPSMMAACAVFLSQRIVSGKLDKWTAALVTETGYDESELRLCCKDMVILLQGI